MNSDKLETRDKRKQAGTIKLSARLLTVAGFVRQGSRIADVGTDHGYIPVYLAQTGRIASALAMDVRPGPLERAQAHVRAVSYTHLDVYKRQGPHPGGKGSHICDE